jgi:hypothetical protein
MPSAATPTDATGTTTSFDESCFAEYALTITSTTLRGVLHRVKESERSASFTHIGGFPIRAF